MECDFFMIVLFVKQKTAYEMRISDWSSDVCSSDLRASLSALITVIAVVVVTPYIALQLKAVSAAYNAVSDHTMPGLTQLGETSLSGDTGLWVAICMGTFVILFGTRNLGADERHPGVVGAEVAGDRKSTG